MTEAALASCGSTRKLPASGAFGKAMMFAVLAIVMAAPIPLASNRPFFWAFWAALISGLLLLWCMFGERGGFSWRALGGAQKAMLLLASAYGVFIFAQAMPLGIVTGPFIFEGAQGGTFRSISPSLAPGDTWHAFLRWWTYCALLLIVLQLAARPSVAHFMHKTVAVIVGIHALWGLCALHIFGDTLLFMQKWTYEGVATGTFVNRNSFATFLGLGAVSATASLAGSLAEPGRARPARLASAAPWLALALLIMTCLYQTHSRMGIVATMTGMAVTLLFFSRRPAQILAAALTVLLLATALVMFQGEGLAERFLRMGPDWEQRAALYVQIAGMIMERPWTGYGAGGFANAYPLFHAAPVANSVTWDHAHSTYLALVLGAGIPFGLIPVLLVATLVLRLTPVAVANAVASPQGPAAIGAAVLVGIHALVDFSLEIQAVAMLFVVMLAIGSAALDEARPTIKAAAGPRKRPAPVGQRPRLSFDKAPDVIYAIGDVHGELDLLSDLEARIVADAAGMRGEKWIIQLGDLIDRGPHSAHVLDRMLDRPPQGFRRFCIAGNHEIMMLKALENPACMDVWLRNGGRETLASYGMSPADIRSSKTSSRNFAYMVESFLPREHLEFLAALPVSIETPRHIFVHAGMAAGMPLSQQGDRELTLTSRTFLELPPMHDKVIVHGHHVVKNACYRNNRISIDTGAYLSGRLTAVRLESGGQFRFLGVPPANR